MSLGIIVVEICDRNALALEALEELETKYPEVAVIRTNCLNMCNLCRARPYALVNERRVYAKTPEACIEEIEVLIKEELNDFYGGE
ncbi:DUF1450 domain-containing protein [Xylanibacillus composti]|uniref:DUF1450 domain-containing protein n=1 Tax=Xylanibacillus composti TaxID=1572762 RepID=A0A8J4H0J7_9BACL|nr:DUF1450 domain-containing protein [Xylanibacillus composti]MDT9726835.1 DUF1450 domain-containing protein [Xylanibacillus composti]GIQ67181.1 hypothetical protein XYCOK13_00050 [Xylanibacillus composti]